MNEPIRVVLVGAGVVAEKKHLPALSPLSEFQVVAVADPDTERRSLLADRCDGAIARATLGDCLEAVEVDVVAVLTPPSTHIPLVRQALEAGKYVFVEKPLCLDLEQAQELLNHPDVSRVLMGFHLRHHRLIERAREMLARGAVGQLQGFRGAWCAPRPPDQSDWKNQRIHGGGAQIELAVHFYDLTRHLMRSELKEIHAYSLSAERDDETTAVLGRTASGLPFSGTFSERASHQMEFEVYGSRGRIKIDCLRFDGLEWTQWGEDTGSVGSRLRRILQTVRELPTGIRSYREGGDYIVSYRRQWQHFGEVVRGEASPLCTAADGLAALLAVKESF
jgi:NDP-hexose-3-ketoreductase